MQDALHGLANGMKPSQHLVSFVRAAEKSEGSRFLLCDISRLQLPVVPGEKLDPHQNDAEQVGQWFHCMHLVCVCASEKMEKQALNP